MTLSRPARSSAGLFRGVPRLAFATSLVASCESRPEPTTLDTWCLTESPMRIANDHVADVIFSEDPRLAEQIIVYNKRGEDKCGWRF